MIIHLKTLFLPLPKNNYKSKILHLSSLSLFLFLIIFFQLLLTLIQRVKPGVLGFAANITPQAIVELTNNYRLQHGLKELKLNDKLSLAAKEKALDMFAKNYWAHYSPTGTSPWWFFEKANYNYLFAGENLARDFAESSEVVKAWLDSPSHKENIINPRYQDIGVAVVNGILNGEETTLVVQLFGTPASSSPAITAQAETQQNLVAKPLPEAYSLQVSSPQTFKFNPPIFSSFVLTKSLSLSLLSILLLVLILDGFLIWKKRIIRISGRNFLHFIFLVIILEIILFIRSGKVI